MRAFTAVATATAVIGTGSYYYIPTPNEQSFTNTPANNTNATTGGNCNWATGCGGCPDIGNDCKSAYGVRPGDPFTTTSDLTYPFVCCHTSDYTIQPREKDQPSPHEVTLSHLTPHVINATTAELLQDMGITKCTVDKVALVGEGNPDYIDISVTPDYRKTCPTGFNIFGAETTLKNTWHTQDGMVLGCKTVLFMYRRVLIKRKEVPLKHQCEMDRDLAIGGGSSVLLLGAGLFCYKKRKDSHGSDGSEQLLSDGKEAAAGAGDDLEEGAGEGTDNNNCCMTAVCCAIKFAAT